MPAEASARRFPLFTTLMTAQRRYAATIRQALVRAGFDDVPPSGARMIGVLARRRSPCSLVELGAELDITRQAASQLAESLVSGGYCVRSPAPQDGRKILLHLSGRGWAVARELGRQIALVERALAEVVGAHELAATRRTLETLGGIELENWGDGEAEGGGGGDVGNRGRRKSVPEIGASARPASGDRRRMVPTVE